MKNDKVEHKHVWALWLLGSFLVVVMILAIFASWFIGYYNNVVTAKNDIKTQWSNIETEYQRRADLFYNLVEATKGYTKYEQSTLTSVIQARSGNFGDSKEAQAETMRQTDAAMLKIQALWEQYPQLQAMPLFKDNIAEFKNTENRIQIARTDYNGIVRSYNIYISKFPNNFLSAMYGNAPEKLFENEVGTSAAPKVNYS